jgi:uncharacterized phiE125 gp8 family phage protein
VYTWRALAVQTFELTLNCFPSGDLIQLPRPPLKTVESITYKDRDGNISTLDPAIYFVDTDSEPGNVGLNPDQLWPSFDPFPVNAIRIQFTAGYETTDIPETIKQGMLLLIGHWYENREAAYIGSVSHEQSFAVDALLLPHRVWG